MPPKLTKIHAAWNEYSSVITKKEVSLKGINVDALIGSFFCPGPFCYYIFDFSRLTTANNYKISFIGLDGEPSYHNVDPATVIDSMEPPEFPFSKREVEIIKLLAEGFIAKEISNKLFISDQTVRTHQKNILSKSRCKTTIELVSKCIREGLI